MAGTKAYSQQEEFECGNNDLGIIDTNAIPLPPSNSILTEQEQGACASKIRILFVLRQEAVNDLQTNSGDGVRRAQEAVKWYMRELNYAYAVNNFTFKAEMAGSVIADESQFPAQTQESPNRQQFTAYGFLQEFEKELFDAQSNTYINALRDYYSADIVVLITKRFASGGSNGQAFGVPAGPTDNSPNIRPQKEFGFVVIDHRPSLPRKIRSGENFLPDNDINFPYILVHEIGHVQGARHETQTGYFPEDAIASEVFATGSAKFCNSIPVYTVMAEAGARIRLPLFSRPSSTKFDDANYYQNHGFTALGKNDKLCTPNNDLSTADAARNNHGRLVLTQPVISNFRVIPAELSNPVKIVHETDTYANIAAYQSIVARDINALGGKIISTGTVPFNISGSICRYRAGKNIRFQPQSNDQKVHLKAGCTFRALITDNICEDNFITFPRISQSNSSIVRQELEPEILLYPNPVEDVLHMSIFGNVSGAMEIGVFDLLGRRVYSSVPQSITDGKANVQIPTSGFEAGMYFTRVIINNTTYTRSFTVMNSQ